MAPPTRQTLLSGALAVVVLVVLAVIVRYIPSPSLAEADTIGSGVTSFKELSDRFTQLARTKGGAYAFDVLRAAKLAPNTDLHLLGHVVGDELYKQKGIDGIADCTQEFRNACSHSIVIGALNEFGPVDSTLSKIDAACHKAPGGPGAYTMCYHGLGHGVFAYFGYDLTKTVALCKRMGTAEYRNEQYLQCVSGAVMELVGGGGHDHEAWLVARTNYLTDDPLAPCDSAVLPNETKGFCYSYLTPHLFERAGAQLASPDPTTFPRAFSFCDAIPMSQSQNRSSCYGGFGKEFVPLAGVRDIRRVDQFSDDAYATAAGWCLSAGPSDGKNACIEQGLESVFWGGENDPAASFRFCADAPNVLQGACYARLGTNIVRYLAPADQKHWCDLLPDTTLCKV